ncbi:MAG: VOC family protein [Thermoplasmata archaeon]|jgi:lactoylglutathione lyase|nr:VOC family protein [Thermoplasmata archaeon]
MSITYAGIRVTDLDRSLRFYLEGLGLRERGRGQMSHGGTFVGLEDPESHFQLELNVYPRDSPYGTPYAVGEGLDHLGLDVVDARALIERLRRMGARVVVEPWLEAGKYWIGFVEDPDGIWIEIQSPVAPATGTVSAPSGPS